MLTKFTKTIMASAEMIEMVERGVHEKMLGSNIPSSTPEFVVERDDEAGQIPFEVRSEFESIKRAMSSFEEKLKQSVSSMSRGDAKVVSENLANLVKSSRDRVDHEILPTTNQSTNPRWKSSLRKVNQFLQATENFQTNPGMRPKRTSVAASATTSSDRIRLSRSGSTGLREAGVDKDFLDAEFSEMYLQHCRTRTEDGKEVEAGLNRQRAAVLLDDAFMGRDPNHLLKTELDLRAYRLIHSDWLQLFFIGIAVFHQALAIFEYRGWGLLSKNPRKYEWGGSTLLAIEWTIIVVYGLYLAFIYRVYRSFRAWNIMYLLVWLVSTVDLIAASTSVDPILAVRLSRALRPFFMVYRFRAMREMMTGVWSAVKTLIPMFTFIILSIVMYAILGITLFPRSCEGLQSETARVLPTVCANDDWKSSLFRNHTLNMSASVDMMCETVAEGMQDGCKMLKEFPGAYYAQGQVYFYSIGAGTLQLLYLMFGSVNYPDVQLPALLTINLAYTIYFIGFLLISILFLNMMLAQVFEGWKSGTEKTIEFDFQRQRTALIECFVVMDDDQNGTIDFDEFSRVVQIVRPEVKDDGNLLHEMFSRVANSEEKGIKLEEFLEVCDALWLTNRTHGEHLVASVHDLPPELSMNDVHVTAEVRDQFNRTRLRMIRSVEDNDDMKTRSCCRRFCYGGLHTPLRAWIRWPGFELSVLSMVILTALSFYGEITAVLACSKARQSTFQIIQWVGVSFLCMEAVIKILAVGIVGYWRVKWWRFDGIALAITLIGQIIYFSKDINECIEPRTPKNGISYSFANVLQTFSFLRLLRVYRYVASSHSLPGSSVIRVLFKAMSGFRGNVIKFLVVYISMMYCFAIIGMYAFGHSKKLHYETKEIGGFKTAGDFTFSQGKIAVNIKGPYITSMTFDTFIGSCLCLWSVTILNNWHVMHEAQLSLFAEDDLTARNLTTVYFVAWILLSVCVWMNLLLSAFLSAYSYELSVEKALVIERGDLSRQERLMRRLQSSADSRFDEKLVSEVSKVTNRASNTVKELSGATRICAITGKSFLRANCPYMVLPTLFESMEPRPVSYTAFVKKYGHEIRILQRKSSKFQVQKLNTLRKKVEDSKGILDIDIDAVNTSFKKNNTTI